MMLAAVFINAFALDFVASFRGGGAGVGEVLAERSEFVAQGALGLFAGDERGARGGEVVGELGGAGLGGGEPGLGDLELGAGDDGLFLEGGGNLAGGGELAIERGVAGGEIAAGLKGLPIERAQRAAYRKSAEAEDEQEAVHVEKSQDGCAAQSEGQIAPRCAVWARRSGRWIYTTGSWGVS